MSYRYCRTQDGNMQAAYMSYGHIRLDQGVASPLPDTPPHPPTTRTCRTTNKIPVLHIVGRVHIEQCQTNINTAVSVPVHSLVDIPTAGSSRVQSSSRSLDFA